MVIEETYAVKDGPYIRQRIGTWSQDAGLTVKQSEKWERRKDLTAVTIYDALQVSSLAPLSTVTESNAGVRNVGYLPDVLKDLSAALNVTVAPVLPPKNSTLANGMVPMLARMEADMCTYGLAVSIDRM